MQCPVCRSEQLIVEVEGVELDLCLGGCGTWFDGQELRQLFELTGAPAGLHDLEQRLEELPRGEHGPVRRCPRCRGRMQHVRAPGSDGGVILDRCRHGHGLWFDPGELEELLSVSLGERDDALSAVRDYLARFTRTGAAPAPATQE